MPPAGLKTGLIDWEKEANTTLSSADSMISSLPEAGANRVKLRVMLLCAKSIAYALLSVAQAIDAHREVLADKR